MTSSITNALGRIATVISSDSQEVATSIAKRVAGWGHAVAAKFDQLRTSAGYTISAAFTETLDRSEEFGRSLAHRVTKGLRNIEAGLQKLPGEMESELRKIEESLKGDFQKLQEFTAGIQSKIDAFSAQCREGVHEPFAVAPRGIRRPLW